MFDSGEFYPLESRTAAQWEAAEILERALAGTLKDYAELDPDEQLAQTPPSGALLERLTAMDLDEADEASLVEVIAAGNRLAACAQALMGQAAGRLAERELMNPTALATHSTDADTLVTTPTGPDKGCTAPEELAPRLGWTRMQTRNLVRRGHAMCHHLINTGGALASGCIDSGRAHAIIDALEDVPWQVAMAVEDEVLPTAPMRTAGQLRRDIARALIAVDPAEAERRAEQRRCQRRVTRPRALPDESAAMTIQGPAADVLALDRALHSRAQAAKADGDKRTVDQLRFDALATIGSDALATGHFGPERLNLPLATANGRAPEIHITMSLAHLIPDGASDTADEAGTIRGLTTRPPGHGPDAPAGHDPNKAPHDADESAGHDRNQHSCHGLDPVAADRTRGLEAPWSWPADPAIGGGPCLSADSVPYLTGYGPITPGTARALAAGGIWRRLVTDPLTGALLDLGHTRYRPSAPLADHVRARDTSCVRPGCNAPAQDCQLDHTTAWNHENPATGGTTSPANLGPLCHRDHQTKTHGDFELSQPEPGVFEWQTPTGHRYRRNRDGSTTSLTHSPPDLPPPF